MNRLLFNQRNSNPGNSTSVNDSTNTTHTSVKWLTLMVFIFFFSSDLHSNSISPDTATLSPITEPQYAYNSSIATNHSTEISQYSSNPIIAFIHPGNKLFPYSLIIMLFLMMALGYLLATQVSSRKNKELASKNNMIKKQLKHLKKANERLENFSSTLSHNAISYIDLIINYSNKEYYQTDSVSAHQILEKIHQSGKSLKQMSNNLIQNMKQKRGGARQNINIAVIWDEIITEFDIMLQDVIIRSDIAVAEVIGEKEQVKQVLVNFLSNSIKYQSPERKLEVTFSTRFSDKNSKQVVFTFEDNGIGISPGKQTQVFKKYFSENHPKKGYGLGLYLSRQMIENMGGTIWIHSEKNKGTQLFFTLPAVIPDSITDDFNEYRFENWSNLPS